MALVIAAVLAVGCAVVTLVAYYTDPPIDPQRTVPPRWDVLPDPADVARAQFPLAMPGYHPATVEMHYEAVGRAYADLLAAAPPEAIAAARQRAALRMGVDLDAEGRPAVVVAAPAAVPLAQEPSDAQALRAEAALADLDAQAPDTP
jgi:hypothetical protein